MSLMDSLGLDEVEADPNKIPDGKYVGEVFKDEFVYVPNKDTISHVFTYKVTEGAHKGAQRTEWFELGVNPQRDENGNIVKIDVTMDEVKKRWYKKRLVDLGVPEQSVSSVKPGDLTGTPINFGVKTNGQYINVNFCEKRTSDAATESQQQQGAITGLL